MLLNKVKASLTHVLLVALALGLGAGTMMAVNAENLDFDSCDAADYINYYPDSDGDGYGDASADFQAACEGEYTEWVDNNEDCDDSDDSIHPSADESCDTVDNNCNGLVDEAGNTYYYDFDDDGYGLSDTATSSCSLPDGYAELDGDCNDEDDSIHPNALELCDEIDNDCDGLTDEEGLSVFYFDNDSDGYGVSDNSTTTCGLPEGYAVYNGDCDDENASAHPNANEICDEVDNDCDGLVDEELDNEYYLDSDGDGYGVYDSATTSCGLPSGYAINYGDCDDSESAAHPGATEICDGIDNDCDGLVDEEGVSVYYLDEDGDGYGQSDNSTTTCGLPEGYAVNDGDCNDDDADINPGAIEVCDDVDNDCDGLTDEEGKTWYYHDYDNDGYGDPNDKQHTCEDPGDEWVSNNNDCDDDNNNVNPGIDEVCDDNIDNNCDTNVDENCDDDDYNSDCDYDHNCYRNRYQPQKVSICHVPKGNPGRAHNISIAESAVKAHLAHGDYLGACDDSYNIYNNNNDEDEDEDDDVEESYTSGNNDDNDDNESYERSWKEKIKGYLKNSNKNSNKANKGKK